MSDPDPYLWNRVDPADPFVEKLERALSPRRAAIEAAVRHQRRRRSRLAIAGALLASAAAAIALWVLCAGDRAAAAPPSDVVGPPIAGDSGAPAAAPEGAAVARHVEGEPSPTAGEAAAGRPADDALDAR